MTSLSQSLHLKLIFTVIADLVLSLSDVMTFFCFCRHHVELKKNENLCLILAHF